MRNPFRRQTETAAPSLRERAADLSSRLASTLREPKAETATGPDQTVSPEVAAALDFAAYVFDEPIKTPIEWAAKFNSPAMAMHIADRTLRMTKPELIAFIRKAGETDAATPEIMFRNLDASQETLEGWGNLLGIARARYLVAASAACLKPDTDSETATGPTAPTAPAEDTFPPAQTDLAAPFDFGPDAHIGELAAEFCEAYAANTVADRASMAGEMPEAEWTPYYRRTVQLMNRLEATEPKTMLGMALKCLAPIGLAGWNAPADGNTDGMDPWERVGAQLADALLAGTLAPLSPVEPRPADLLAAAGLALDGMALKEVASLHDITVTLGNVVRAISCQPRCGLIPNDAGKFVNWLGHQLDTQIDRTVKELRSREPADWTERGIRLEAIAEATVSNGDPAQTAAFARELLATVEK